MTKLNKNHCWPGETAELLEWGKEKEIQNLLKAILHSIETHFD